MSWDSAAMGQRHGPVVVVTGATGFLGKSLTDRLLRDGARVRVLARSMASAKPLEDRGAQVVVGDVTDPGSVSAAVREAEVVYHLAGRLLAPGIPDEEYQRTHVEGTRVLLACCRQSSSLKRFVHCSTTGVLGVTGELPADEEAPIRPTNVYEATKAEAELAVRAAAQAGFPAVIARPGLVYGPGDLHLLPFVRSVLRGLFRPIGRRPVWLHPVYIDDVTEALVRCGALSATSGECFHVAGAEPATLAELASAIAMAGGVHLPRGHVPMLAAQIVAAVGDRLPDRLKPAAPLTSSRLDFLTHNRMYDVTKARRLLAFAAATDLPTGAAKTMHWYRRHGYIAAPSNHSDLGFQRPDSNYNA